MNTHVAPVAAPKPTNRLGAVPYRPSTEAIRLWLLSDLRVHERPFVPPSPPPAFDALIVAGNVMPGLVDSVLWLAETFAEACEDKPLVYVPGCVEFEDGVPVAEALARADLAAKARNVSLLHDASVRLGQPERPGVHVVGATLWPAFAFDGRRAGEARGHGRHRWQACRRVRSAPGIPFLPHDAVGANSRSRAYVEDALRAIWANGECVDGRPSVVGPLSGGDRAVVATAYPPMRVCLPPALRRPIIDPWAANWLASDLDDLFDGPWAPDAWLHGAVPNALDMRVGRTRVVANPRLGEDPTRGFDAGRVVAV